MCLPGAAARRTTKRTVVATIALLACFVAAGCAGHKRDSNAGTGTEPGPAFASPQDAVDALVDATRSGSPERIVGVLGSDADELVRSGDDVQDRNRTKRFVTLYDEHHEILPTAVADNDDDASATTNPPANPSTNRSLVAPDDDSSQTLRIGDSRWPFPIPIVKDGDGKWRFDTARGRGEVLNRRVGRNELRAIETLHAIIDAERDYVSRRVSQPGGLPEYAGKLVSDDRQTNGLYWPAVPGQPPSPLDDLVASAAEEGYEIRADQPYRGYFYRFLKSQGPSATGGAYDYDVNGKLLGGFAVIARPATYGNSGVMTFVVNQDGTVYQTDLGPQTETAADQIRSFDPDSRWTKVDDVD